MDELTLTTNIVTAVDGFRPIAREWDDLVDRSARRTYFLRWHWNWLWWENFAPAAARLHVICCRDRDGALAGLAPLYLKPRPVLSVLPLQELHFLGTGIGLRVNEYMDILARPGREAAVCRAIGASLAACREWDRLRLHGVPREGGESSGLLGTLNLASRTVDCDRAPYIDTSQGWEAYKSTLGKSMRRNVEYYPRRLFQLLLNLNHTGADRARAEREKFCHEGHQNDGRGAVDRNEVEGEIHIDKGERQNHARNRVREEAKNVQ